MSALVSSPATSRVPPEEIIELLRVVEAATRAQRWPLIADKINRLCMDVSQRKNSPRNWEGNPWSETEISLAANLWAAGQTMAQIARATGRSRNAICGMTRRNRERFPARPEGQGIEVRPLPKGGQGDAG